MSAVRLTAKEWQTLQDFVAVAEEFASSDTEMPSHKDTSDRFDKLLEAAKQVLHH